jgi:hypothetical protein
MVSGATPHEKLLIKTWEDVAYTSALCLAKCNAERYCYNYAVGKPKSEKEGKC